MALDIAPKFNKWVFISEDVPRWSYQCDFCAWAIKAGEGVCGYAYFKRARNFQQVSALGTDVTWSPAIVTHVNIMRAVFRVSDDVTCTGKSPVEKDYWRTLIGEDDGSITISDE